MGLLLFVIPIVNLIANLDHEGVELSLLNVLRLISAPKETIKIYKNICLDVFDKILHALICHVSREKSNKVVGLIGGGSGINEAYPV